MGIKIKFYNLDTFKKQVDVDLDSEFVDLNYKDASLIFCHFWRSIGHQTDFQAFELCEIVLILIPFLGTFEPKSTPILNFFGGGVDFRACALCRLRCGQLVSALRAV